MSDSLSKLEKRTAYTLVLPAVLLVFAIVLFPIFANVWISFKDIELKDIYFRNQDGTISLFSESVKLNLDYSSIFTGSWGLSNLFLNNVFQ